MASGKGSPCARGTGLPLQPLVPCAQGLSLAFQSHQGALQQRDFPSAPWPAWPALALPWLHSVVHSVANSETRVSTKLKS